MGFASVFPCNIKVLRSYDAHGLEVFSNDVFKEMDQTLRFGIPFREFL